MCLIHALSTRPAFAQDRMDMAVLGGWTKPSAEGSVLEFNWGTTYEVSTAWRIATTRHIDVAIDVPFLATNSLSTKTAGATLPREYAVLSLTPGIRVMFAAKRVASVFAEVGGGFAAYEESALRTDGNPNVGSQSNSTGAVAFGGGIDVRSGSWLGLRGEVHDVITGARRFAMPTPGERVQNVVATIGLVVRP